MRILIDTNRYRDFCEGVTEVVEQFRVSERVCLPFVVLAELRAGFLAGSTFSRPTAAARARLSCVVETTRSRHRVAGRRQPKQCRRGKLATRDHSQRAPTAPSSASKSASSQASGARSTTVSSSS